MSEAWQRFESGSEAELERFVTALEPSRPVRVILEGPHFGPNAGQILARVRPDAALRFLSIRGTELGDAGLEALLSAPALASLPVLALERSGVTDRGVAALAAAPSVRGVRELSLCNRRGVEQGVLNVITDAGALRLATSQHLPLLESLDLWNSRVTERGFEALVLSTSLDRLRTLHTWGTSLDAPGAKRLKAQASTRANGRAERHEPQAWACAIHTDFDLDGSPF